MNTDFSVIQELTRYRSYLSCDGNPDIAIDQLVQQGPQLSAHTRRQLLFANAFLHCFNQPSRLFFDGLRDKHNLAETDTPLS